MSRLCYDIETDGLLDEVTTIHCIAVIDVDTREEALYSDSLAMLTQGTLDQGVQRLMLADMTIGHNVIKYDHPVIEKITGKSLPREKTFDTLVGAGLVWSNIKDIDNRRSYVLGRLFGSHSLEAWGVRLGGELKMEYAPVIDPDQPVYDPKCRFPKKDPRWKGSVPSKMMFSYCLQDVRVNVDLFHRIERKLLELNYQRPFALEQDASWLLAKQERNGFKFDEEKAHKLLAKLSARREYLYSQLLETFGGWWVSEGVVTPVRSINYKDPTKPSRLVGASFTKVKYVTFNPSSRKHIVKVLLDKGWKPTEFTPSGEPKVDETVLKGMKFPEAELMAEWFLIQKRLGQLSDGANSWLGLVTADGYIHHTVRPNAANSSRASHHAPNLAQVPGCRSEYGAECRELFTVPPGWLLMGSDASGLELRCLAHYMAKYDGGEYIDAVLNGDVHVYNQKAAGLPTRDQAKTFAYSVLYGAGGYSVGMQLGYTQEEYEVWKANGQGKKTFNRINKMREKREEKPLSMSPEVRDMICYTIKGEEAIKKFKKNLKGYKELSSFTADCHAEDRFIVGLDGRRLASRSQHSSLNLLLQSAGAIITKAWIVEIEKIAIAKGLKHGRDGDFFYCAWVHDEVQVAVKDRQTGEMLGEICQEAMRKVQKDYNFKCQLDTEYGIGESWKDTH